MIRDMRLAQGAGATSSSGTSAPPRRRRTPPDRRGAHEAGGHRRDGRPGHRLVPHRGGARPTACLSPQGGDRPARRGPRLPARGRGGRSSGIWTTASSISTRRSPSAGRGRTAWPQEFSADPARPSTTGTRRCSSRRISRGSPKRAALWGVNAAAHRGGGRGVRDAGAAGRPARPDLAVPGGGHGLTGTRPSPLRVPAGPPAPGPPPPTSPRR